MEKLKITIITPSFNQGSFIEDTISSVLNQNYKNLEYIVIDGGSEDNTKDVLKKYSDKIAYWISEKDRGQSDALNKGFEKTSGDIMAWLNSDDLYTDNTFAQVAQVFEENPDINIVYGDVVNFTSTKEELYINKEFEILDFFSRVSIHQPGVFWRRDAILKAGKIDESLFYCMDYDLWMRLFLNNKALKINKVFSKFRIHESSKTNDNPIGLYAEYQKIMCRFFNSLESTVWKDKLIKLKIYFNEDNKKYIIRRRFSKTELKKIFDIYIQKSIEIEYVKNNKETVNSIIFKTPKTWFNYKNLIALGKANLHLHKLKKKS
jgi:glycosyltransferase involved in cell wall biosynthesis